MRRVLMLYKNFGIGGAENLILSLCGNINKEEYKVYLAANINIDDIQDEIEYYDIGEMSFSPKLLMKSIKTIYGICKKNKIDIIHSHHRYTTVVALIVGGMTNIKVLHTEHNVFPDKNWMNFRGENIVAVSNSVRNNLIQNKVNPKNVSTIHNGISYKEAERVVEGNLKRELSIDESEFTFGFIGRLEEQKGLKYLIPAFKKLIDNGIKAKLVLVGDGGLRVGIEEFIRKEGLESDVILLGFRNDIANIIESLDMFILPSIYEGFPMTNLEIMSRSKVLIATDVGGNKEVIEDRINGFLIKSKSEKEIVQAMEYACNNKHILKKMGSNAKDTIVGNFTVGKMSEKYERYYCRLLE